MRKWKVTVVLVGLGLSMAGLYWLGVAVAGIGLAVVETIEEAQ